MPTKVTIEEAVRESLDNDRRLRRPAELAVMVDDGVVTLRGTVGTFGQRLAAVRDARKVRGVEYVEDQIEVRILDVDRRSDAAYGDVAKLFGVIGITNEIRVVNL
jgi:BON domain